METVSLPIRSAMVSNEATFLMATKEARKQTNLFDQLSRQLRDLYYGVILPKAH